MDFENVEILSYRHWLDIRNATLVRDLRFRFYTSRDNAINEPLANAGTVVYRYGTFAEAFAAKAWDEPWESCDMCIPQDAWGKLYPADIGAPPSLYVGPPLGLRLAPIFSESDVLRLG